MDKAVSRLNKALGKKERIMVYGDYDVDGTTSVALVYKYLLNYYSNLEYYIPTRYEEGYGYIFDFSIAEKVVPDVTAELPYEITFDSADNEVLASIPDPIRIVNAVAEAKALRAKAQAGTEPGYFPYDAIAKFDAAIATANDAVKAGITLEEIERVIAALDAATVDFMITTPS